MTTGLKNYNNIIPNSRFTDGTTIDTYESVVSWECGGLSDKSFLIVNTGSINSLLYSINTYIYGESTYYYSDATDISVSAGNSALVTVTRACSKIVVKVKSELAGNSTTYQVDYSGY